MTSPHLAPRERAAVLWAEHVTRNTAREREDVFEEVRKHFNEAEIVELTLMSGFFNMLNRFMESLQIPIEEQREVAKIRRTVHLDPEKMKGYFEDVAANWPAAFPAPEA